MSKILAFFDARFCSAGPLWEAAGRLNHWRWSLEPRALRKYHLPILTPSSLGAYDLARPEQAAAVVAAARGAGLAGFVLDLLPAGDGFVSGADLLDAQCDDGFGLAFQWDNGAVPGGDDWQFHHRQCAAVVAALRPWRHVLLGGRPVLVVRQPYALRDPALTVAMLRREAVAAGLPGLYVVAVAAERQGRLAEADFDALLDPDPAQWVSCERAVRDDGFALLQAMAGCEDAAALADVVLDYRTFACSRMVNRTRRGKVLPRVLPGYADWADHPDGGAVILTNLAAALYGQFLRKAIAVVEDGFPADERAVFIDSWNGWRQRSQLEPTTRSGDALLRDTRDAIAWGRYLGETQRPHRKAAERPLSAASRARIDAVCARLALTAEGQG